MRGIRVKQLRRKANEVVKQFTAMGAEVVFKNLFRHIKRDWARGVER
jgi:hypothetical protein